MVGARGVEDLDLSLAPGRHRDNAEVGAASAAGSDGTVDHANGRLAGVDFAGEAVAAGPITNNPDTVGGLGLAQGAPTPYRVVADLDVRQGADAVGSCDIDGPIPDWLRIIAPGTAFAPGSWRIEIVAGLIFRDSSRIEKSRRTYCADVEAQ